VTLVTAAAVGFTQFDGGQGNIRLASLAPSFGAPSGPITSVDQAPLLAVANIDPTPTAEATQPVAEATPEPTTTPEPKRTRRAVLAHQETGEPRRTLLGARRNAASTDTPARARPQRLSTL